MMDKPGLQFVPGGATQDPFKILDRPVYDAPGFFDEAANAALWGRAAKAKDEVEIVSIRELTVEELAALQPKRLGESNTALRAVERLRPRHHEIARLMASGLKDTEIAGVLDVSLPHLHRLRRSPAFQHLLAYYMAQRDREALTIRDRIEQASSLALERVQERLEDEDNPVPLNHLKDITFGLLDRAGFNPTNKIASVSATLTANDLQQLKDIRNAAIRAATGVQVLEASAETGSTEPGLPLGGPSNLVPRVPISGPEGQRPPMGAPIPQASRVEPEQLDLFGPSAPPKPVVSLFGD